MSSIGAVRRLQALVAIGYPIADLARALQLPLSLTYAALESTTVPDAVQTRAQTLYDLLSMRLPDPNLPEVQAAKHYASTYGWAPPLAWDDDTIDDPDATPSGVRPARPLSVRGRVLDLLEDGVPVAELPHRIGWPLTRIISAIRDPQLREDLRAKGHAAGVLKNTTRRRTAAA